MIPTLNAAWLLHVPFSMKTDENAMVKKGKSKRAPLILELDNMHFSLFCLDSASNKCITSRNQTNPEKIRVRFFAIRYSSYLSQWSIGAFALEIFFLLLSRFHHRLFLCSLLPLLLLLLSFSCILRCFSVYYLTSEVHTDPITRSARCVCSFALVPPFYDDKKKRQRLVCVKGAMQVRATLKTE